MGLGFCIVKSDRRSTVRTEILIIKFLLFVSPVFNISTSVDLALYHGL